MKGWARDGQNDSQEAGCGRVWLVASGLLVKPRSILCRLDKQSAGRDYSDGRILMIRGVCDGVLHG